MPERSKSSGLGYRLDHLSPGVSLGLGAAGVSAVVVPLAVGAGFWGAAAGTVACVAGAVWVASRGQAIAVFMPVAVVEPPRPVPKPDIDELLDMFELPGGTFLMGSADDEPGRWGNEGPVHEVTLSPFAMAKTPITQGLYREIMGQNPGSPQGDELPVNNVNFLDAVRFCNALSERVGLKPCYSGEGDEVTWDRAADGYRLPTEAEWEYATRAGTRTRYFFGDDEARLGEYAWFTKNASSIQPVSKKRPNGWGLYDLCGNVWEWCWDRSGAYGDKPEHNSSPAYDRTHRMRVSGPRAAAHRSRKRILRLIFGEGKMPARLTR